MLSKYGNCTRLLKITTSWKLVVFTNKVGKNSRICGVFNITIISLALVGYEMIIDKVTRRLSTISYPTRTHGVIVKYIYFIFDD